jgi:hypothetical protein
MPALLQIGDEMIEGRQESGNTMTAFEYYLPASERSCVRAQRPLEAQHVTLDSYFAMPDLSEIDTLSASQVHPEVDTIIGTIRLSGEIMCQHSGCKQPFGRLAELKRHYTTSHAVEKPEYWCSQPMCDRGMVGGRPFYRRDKMRDHERSVHHRNV